MRQVAEMLQRNPALVLVLMAGVPAMTWAAAYARRPSRARKRVAVGALVVMAGVTVVAVVEAMGAGGAWWVPVVIGAGIGGVWALLFARGRR